MTTTYQKPGENEGASAYVTTSHTLAGQSQFLTFFCLNHHKTAQERPILTNVASNDATLHAEYNSVSCVAQVLKFAEIVGKMPKNRKSIITQQITNQMEWDKSPWTPDYIFYLAGITSRSSGMPCMQCIRVHSLSSVNSDWHYDSNL